MAAPKPTKPLLEADPAKILQRPPLSPRQGKNDGRYRGPEGKNDQGGPVLFYRHELGDDESWETIAEDAGYADPAELIDVNFGTVVSEEVNYYLGHWVGCNRTRDGINYSFSKSAHPGFIWLPKQRGLKYKRPIPTPRDCSLHILNPVQILRVPWSTNLLRFRAGGVATVGMLVPSVEGVRLLLSITMSDVVFTLVSARSAEFAMLRGKIIQQNITCAINEYDGGWGKDVYEKTKGLQVIARAEIEILMGMVAGSGNFAKWAYGLTNLFDYFAHNRERLFKMARAVRVIWESMGQVRTLSPVFYEVMKDAFYEGAVTTLGEFGSAVTGDPADAFGKVLGVLISDQGPDLIAGRLTATKVLKKALDTVIQGVKDKAGDAYKIAVKDYDDKAGNLALKFQSHGVAVSREDLIKIREDVERNPDAIKAALDRMTSALGDI